MLKIWHLAAEIRVAIQNTVDEENIRPKVEIESKTILERVEVG